MSSKFLQKLNKIKNIFLNRELLNIENKILPKENKVLLKAKNSKDNSAILKNIGNLMID